MWGLIQKEAVKEKERRNGKTSDKSAFLDRSNLPSFMEVEKVYQMVTGPVLLKETHYFLKVFKYSVRKIDGGDTFYVDSTLNLPRRFLVRKVTVAGWSWYDYLPIETKDKMSGDGLPSFAPGVLAY